VIGGLYTLLLFGLVTLEATGRLRVPAFLMRLGDMSFTVYLSHILVLGAIGRLWGLVGPLPGTRGDNAVAIAAMLSAVVIYGWWGYRLVERPLQVWTHRRRARLFPQPSAPLPVASSR
jgi:hypothetical protein